MPFQKIKNCVIICVIFVLITISPHAGIILGLIAIFLIPAFIWNTYKIVVDPTSRKIRLLEFGIWSVSLAIVIGFHAYYHFSARSMANSIVVKIERFHDREGRYPERLEDIDISASEFRAKVGMGLYSSDGHTASLFYAVTYTVFDTYRYDFSKRVWVYNNS